MAETKGIIFDCFGVIITDALQAMSDRHVGGDPVKSQRMSDIIVASNRGFLARDEAHEQIAELFGISFDELRAGMKDREVKSHDVLDYARELKRAGYKVALLSNVSSTGLRHRFSQEELDAHFDAVVASGEIGFAKPEPQAYEIAADRLGLRLEECLMIDDRQVCVDGAHGVGMKAVLYQNLSGLKHDLESLL